jgi:hypothetical protein
VSYDTASDPLPLTITASSPASGVTAAGTIGNGVIR